NWLNYIYNHRKGGVKLRKKKFLSIILAACMVISTILFFDLVNPIGQLKKISLGNRITFWLASTILLIYYKNSFFRLQLVPSVLSNDKPNNKERDKPNISFKDVAGHEEIKEELQETIYFLNN